MKKKIICISIFTLIIIVIGSMIILQINKKEVMKNENIEQDVIEESEENKIIRDVSNLEQEESTEELEIVDNTAETQREIASNESLEI